jgi:hypothetical protein
MTVSGQRYGIQIFTILKETFLGYAAHLARRKDEGEQD